MIINKVMLHTWTWESKNCNQCGACFKAPANSNRENMRGRDILSKSSTIWPCLGDGSINEGGFLLVLYYRPVGRTKRDRERSIFL